VKIVRRYDQPLAIANVALLYQYEDVPSEETLDDLADELRAEGFRVERLLNYLEPNAVLPDIIEIWPDIILVSTSAAAGALGRKGMEAMLAAAKRAAKRFMARQNKEPKRRRVIVRRQPGGEVLLDLEDDPESTEAKKPSG
jgi:hypothetical protein